MRFARFNRPRLAPIVLLLAATACGDGGTAPLVPAAFQVVDGNGQTGTVGTTVPIAPAVKVTTKDGRAVPEVAVMFTVSRGGGTVTGNQVKTDASGVARLGSWTLGTLAGENELTATSAAVSGGRASWTATGNPDAPTALIVATQPSTTSSSGASLPVQPIVRTADRHGNPTPRAGVLVTASAAGNATLRNATAVTDATGTATFAQLGLSGVSGPYMLLFKADGFTDARAAEVTFLAAGAAHHLAMGAQTITAAFPNQRLRPAITVNVVDDFGNLVTASSVIVQAALDGTGAVLSGRTTATAVSGVATFDSLLISTAGSHRLRFTAAGLGDVTSAALDVVAYVPLNCGTPQAGGVKLDFQLGSTVRRFASQADAPTCLEFDVAKARGQQYLVLFENTPMTGGSTSAFFPSGQQSATSFEFAVESQPAEPGAGLIAALRGFPNALASEPAPHQWDFGDGPIYEGKVEAPLAFRPQPRLLRDGASIALDAMTAPPNVGDTLFDITLEGIQRLGIPRGAQKAVVRYVSDHIIFAEDVRLGTTLTRENGSFNAPMPVDTMRVIAEEYARYAAAQGDLLFEGRHNGAVEAGGQPARVLAVHTLMYADNIWGYTYPTGTYFAFDYWVSTSGNASGCLPAPNGSPCLGQRAQRLADNLFMHEIAHMRHAGMNERAGKPRGNTWLVEGFARFSERLPIAMRLLGSMTPSRTGNIVLPYIPPLSGCFFFEDVPDYRQASSNLFGGYAASAYVFDYFMDQVASSGGDPLAALRDFVVNAGDEATLNAAVNRWIPGLTFPELFTRARIALYTDDYGAGLPVSTQYTQFQLRASRPATGTQAVFDPRNAWLKLSPGKLERVESSVLSLGAARGVIIDGTIADAANARILIDASRGANGVISITRIR